MAQIGAMLGGRGRRRAGVDAAQDLMYRAWEERDPKRRIALAREALDVSPDCADAYVLLAEEAARSQERHQGDLAGAIGHFQEMLRLNPNDNQGVRYQLAACLLEAGEDDALDVLLSRYADDGTAVWKWSAALLEYRRSGDVALSRQLVREAETQNPHVAAYLLGKKKLPALYPTSSGSATSERRSRTRPSTRMHGAVRAAPSTGLPAARILRSVRGPRGGGGNGRVVEGRRP